MVKYPKYIFTASMKNPLAWLLSIYITVLENCQLLVCIWIRCPLCDQEILSTVSKKWSFSPLHPTDKQMLPAIVTVAFRCFKNLSQKCCIFIQTCFISAEAWKILRKESSSRVDAPLAWTHPSFLPLFPGEVAGNVQCSLSLPRETSAWYRILTLLTSDFVFTSLI